MKTYRSPEDVRAEVERALARSPQPGCSPLDDVAEILCRTRNYPWVGIYLVAGPAKPAAEGGKVVEMPQSTTAVPIKIGQRVLGAVQVQTAGPLRADDRILLRALAARLAKFLHEQGRYLLRKARQSAAADAQSPQLRGRQPESEKASHKTVAAAGDSR